MILFHKGGTGLPPIPPKEKVFLVPKHYFEPFSWSLKVSMFLIFWSICWWSETNQNMFQNRLLVACVSSIGPLARSDYHRTDRLGEQVLELIDMKHCHLELLRWEYHIRKCYGKLFSSSSSSSTIRILDRKRIRWVSQFIHQTLSNSGGTEMQLSCSYVELKFGACCMGE